MKSIIETYARKVLEIGCNIQKGDSLVVYSQTDISDFEEVLLKLKDEYQISQIVFLRDNLGEIYNFLKSNPTLEDIKAFVTKYPRIEDSGKVKIISTADDDHEGYYFKLCDEVFDLYEKYYDYDRELNKEIYDLFNTRPKIAISCATKDWAKSLLGSDDKKDELWKLISKTVPNVTELNEEISKLKYIREFLQKSSIKRLEFHTSGGTEFEIGLSKNSIWTCAPTIRDGHELFYNFPSYEIFTSPDYNYMEGRVVLTRPSSIYGSKIQSAELQFSKGKCISCQSDNEAWNHLVLSEETGLSRIGEIALVSNDTPLAKLRQSYDSLLLDENSGCHLALGYALPECINVSQKLLDEKGLKHYNFNSSLYHQDLVFGDDSVSVEATTKGKKKILLMENGVWKI